MALHLCLGFFFSIAGAEVWKVGDTQASRNLLPVPTRILWQSGANQKRVFVYVCACVYIYSYEYAFVYVLVYLYKYVYMCLSVCVCMCVPQELSLLDGVADSCALPDVVAACVLQKAAGARKYRTSSSTSSTQYFLNL